MSVEELLNTIKTLESSDLFKIMKAVSSELEKKSKESMKESKKEPKESKKSKKEPKEPKEPKEQKEGKESKPIAWVKFTLKHALENGWESFTVQQKKKDKETGEVVQSVLEKSGSILHEEKYIYDGSITEKSPNGIQITYKDAMSLSKYNRENRHSIYEIFEAEYGA